MKRVLITGSRDWEDVRAIEQALLEYHPVDPQGFDRPGDKPTLVRSSTSTSAGTSANAG